MPDFKTFKAKMRIDFGWGDNSYFVSGNIVTLVLYYYRADTAERCRLC